MVLESIINPVVAEHKPVVLIFIGFLYGTIAFLIGSFLFNSEASLISIFLIVFSSVPLFYNTMKYEEKKDEIITKDTRKKYWFFEKIMLHEHSKALKFFIYFFIGLTICYAFWYSILPRESIMKLFASQAETISTINGHFTKTAGEAAFSFLNIFLNNMRVLVLCTLFAFIYGAGAVFIITWNASIVGVAIGNIIREGIAQITIFSSKDLFSYFHVISYGVLRYSLHGIPEVVGYFIAGLAGSIISYASIKYSFETKKYSKVLLDAGTLMLISIGIIIIAAFIEVFITPLVF